MRLLQNQKEHALKLIAQGLRTDEINAAAKNFKPPYQLSRAQIYYYRVSRKVRIAEIRNASERGALKKGFALKEHRVESLDKLASKLEGELSCEGEGNRLWVPSRKMIGSGEKAMQIVEEEFNQAEVKEFRGLLDDIAKETGERRQKVEHMGKDGESLKIEVVYAESSIDPHGASSGAGEGSK